MRDDWRERWDDWGGKGSGEKRQREGGMIGGKGGIGKGEMIGEGKAAGGKAGGKVG